MNVVPQEGTVCKGWTKIFLCFSFSLPFYFIHVNHYTPVTHTTPPMSSTLWSTLRDKIGVFKSWILMLPSIIYPSQLTHTPPVTLTTYVQHLMEPSMGQKWTIQKMNQGILTLPSIIYPSQPTHSSHTHHLCPASYGALYGKKLTIQKLNQGILMLPSIIYPSQPANTLSVSSVLWYNDMWTIYTGAEAHLSQC